MKKQECLFIFKIMIFKLMTFFLLEINHIVDNKSCVELPILRALALNLLNVIMRLILLTHQIVFLWNLVGECISFFCRTFIFFQLLIYCIVYAFDLKFGQIYHSRAKLTNFYVCATTFIALSFPCFSLELQRRISRENELPHFTVFYHFLHFACRSIPRRSQRTFSIVHCMSCL